MATISMTCSSCQRGFKRRTRKGLRTSCPHCGNVMPGPEGQRIVAERLQQLEGQRARRRTRERARKPPAAPTPQPAAPAPPPRRRAPPPRPPPPPPPPPAPRAAAQGAGQRPPDPLPPRQQAARAEGAGAVPVLVSSCPRCGLLVSEVGCEWCRRELAHTLPFEGGPDRVGRFLRALFMSKRRGLTLRRRRPVQRGPAPLRGGHAAVPGGEPGTPGGPGMRRSRPRP